MIFSQNVLIVTITGVLILSICYCIRRIEIAHDEDDSITEFLV